MRAAYYEGNGSAREVLRVVDVVMPNAGPGEVRVKLATSGVNPSDVKSRQGATRKIAWPRVIPQSDGAGVIDQVGDGVPKSRIGERVWVWNGQWKRAFGTAAEFITLPAAQAVKLPDKVSFEAGACLGIPAMTAYHAIAVGGATKGSTLLVAGGAGSVSQYVIQFAKMAGATVLTTISSPDKAKAAREAGADHAIDYKRDNVGERRCRHRDGSRRQCQADPLGAEAEGQRHHLRNRSRGGAAGGVLPGEYHHAQILPGL
jgi:NADPH2:quinone reductase